MNDYDESVDPAAILLTEYVRSQSRRADKHPSQSAINGHRTMFESAIVKAKSLSVNPFAQKERGIVIPGGGKYFASAYVTIRMLRHVGCKLPIELWHLKDEISNRQMEIAYSCDVQCCIDADAHLLKGFRSISGWQLKPFAVLNSQFSEILFLDADCYPIRDPSYLFDEPAYSEHGAIFWPDQPAFDLKPEVWEAVGLPYRDEADFDSGVFVVNKSRWHQALWLTDWMNRHSDHYYRLFHGDKSTWHLAARALGMNYGMPGKRWVGSRGTMIHYAPVQGLNTCNIQHDLPLFYHRARDKFSLSHNRLMEFSTSPQRGERTTFNADLQLEGVAHGFLRELEAMMPQNRERVKFSLDDARILSPDELRNRPVGPIWAGTNLNYNGRVYPDNVFHDAADMKGAVATSTGFKFIDPPRRRTFMDDILARPVSRHGKDGEQWFVEGLPDGAFNPGAGRWNGRIVMAFRTGCGFSASIWIGKLDENMVPRTKLRLGQLVQCLPCDEDAGYEDPRLVVNGDRLFLSCAVIGAGGVVQGLCEINDDLTVRGRFDTFDSPENRIEKNWIFFPHDEHSTALNFIYHAGRGRHEVYALRDGSIAPGWTTPNPVAMCPRRGFVSATKWGEIRGGTNPVMHDGEWLTFFHSSRRMGKDSDIRYFMGAYTFESKPPYRITSYTPSPIYSPVEISKANGADKKRVIFPGGLVKQGNDWLIFSGFNDERCVISRMSIERLKGMMVRT